LHHVLFVFFFGTESAGDQLSCDSSQESVACPTEEMTKGENLGYYSPLYSAHPTLILWFGKSQTLDPVPTHQPVQSRHGRHEVHHGKASFQGLDVLIDVLILFQPTEWLTEHERGDDIQCEILGQPCKVDSARFQIFPFDQMDQRLNCPVYAWFEVWIVFAGILRSVRAGRAGGLETISRQMRVSPASPHASLHPARKRHFRSRRQI